MTRTRWIGVVLLCAVLGGALWSTAAQKPTGDGTLAFKAHSPVGQVTIGLEPLGIGDTRDGFVFVPKGNGPRNAMPLAILLHGATQRARLFERFTAAAESAGVVILAPDSRAITWDAIRGDFGTDIEFLDRAIERAFDRAYIDSCRVVVGGFSDGASYAMSLGIRNARLLHGAVAFSPGFVIPTPEPQRLPIFIRHGTSDQILPINSTSRPLLRALREEGFDVDYEEFEGPHMVRPPDFRRSLDWVSRRTCAR